MPSSDSCVNSDFDAFGRRWESRAASSWAFTDFDEYSPRDHPKVAEEETIGGYRFFAATSSRGLVPACDQVTELADFDLLQTGLSPAVERSRSLRLIVFGSEHIEGVQHGPFLELAAIQAVPAVVVGDREKTLSEFAKDGHSTHIAADTQEQRREAALWVRKSQSR